VVGGPDLRGTGPTTGPVDLQGRQAPTTWDKTVQGAKNIGGQLSDVGKQIAQPFQQAWDQGKQQYQQQQIEKQFKPLQDQAGQLEAGNVANTAQNSLTMPSAQNTQLGQMGRTSGLAALGDLSKAAPGAGYDMNASRSTYRDNSGTWNKATGNQATPGTGGQDFPKVQDTQRFQDLSSDIANINQQGAQDMANWRAPKIDLPQMKLPGLPNAGLPGASSFKPAPAVAQTNPPNTQPRG
jgi:hypothetical protein